MENLNGKLEHRLLQLLRRIGHLHEGVILLL